MPVTYPDIATLVAAGKTATKSVDRLCEVVVRWWFSGNGAAMRSFKNIGSL